MSKKWTHAELCKKAVSWLKRGHTQGGCGCPNAYSEVASGSNGGEIVDSIGIKTADGTETIVVEVKVSTADFHADARKSFRANPDLGMGNYRYYLCPEDLIKITDLPPKWGLLYVGARGKITVVCGHLRNRKEEWYFKSNRDAELGMTSILLGKKGDVETLNQTMRLNDRLEARLAKVERELSDLKMPSKTEKIINNLNELIETQNKHEG